MSKKLKIYLLAVLTFLVSVFSLTACEKLFEAILDEDTPVGTYYLDSIKVEANGAALQDSDIQAMLGTYEVGDTLPDYILGDNGPISLKKTTIIVEMNDDGSLSIWFEGKSAPESAFNEVTWEEKDGKIIFTGVDNSNSSLAYDNGKVFLSLWRSDDTGSFYVHITFKKDTSSSNSTESNENPLLGTYYTYAIKEGDTTYSLGEEYNEILIEENVYILIIEKAPTAYLETTVKTYENDKLISVGRTRVAVSWTQSGNSLTLQISFTPNNSTTLNATVNGDYISMTIAENVALILKKGEDLPPDYSYGSETQYSDVSESASETTAESSVLESIPETSTSVSEDINVNSSENPLENSNESVEDTPLTPLGTYYFYSMTADGNTVYVGDGTEDFTYTADYFVITLKENGEMTICSAGNEETSGTWTQEGDTIALTADGETLNAIWDADSLTIEDNELIMVLIKNI